MADRASERKLLDIDLGPKGGPVPPVVDAFRNRGVPVHEDTVGHLRSHRTSGEKVADRLYCAGLVRLGDTRRKDACYLRIAYTALAVRAPQLNNFAHRWRSNGQTEAMAELLRLSPQLVRRCIRAMRAELVYADVECPETDVRQTFGNVANHYFYVYSYPANSTLRASINAVADNWDGRTLRSFYALLYGYGPRTIGTWHPYEAEVFQRYYEAASLIARGHRRST